LTAADLLGETADIERFTSAAHFARHAGVAPIPASSGRRQRAGSTEAAIASSTARCTGSRSCGAARAAPPPTTSPAEKPGKSRIEALRCLKRHLARVVSQASGPDPTKLLRAHPGQHRRTRPALDAVKGASLLGRPNPGV
jgi:transposase